MYRGTKGKRRRLASQTENRQPERMRVVIIRVPVKSFPFIPGSFRILLHLFRARHLFVQDFSRPGKYFLYALRNTSELFEDAGKKPTVPITRSTLTSLVARARKRRRKTELLDNLLSSLSAEASTHNEFIKHRKAAAPNGVKRWEKCDDERREGMQQTTTEYLFIAIASHRRMKKAGVASYYLAPLADMQARA